jgi:ABC-2 type transport system ATP-binding protein
VAQVVRASHTDRQASLLARTNGPIPDPAWTAHRVSLEDVVLAYLADPSAGTLPGPSSRNDSLEVHP